MIATSAGGASRLRAPPKTLEEQTESHSDINWSSATTADMVNSAPQNTQLEEKDEGQRTKELSAFRMVPE